MAKCILPAGIESISGTMKKNADGSRLLYQTYKRLQPDGTYKSETRVYLRPKYKRSKGFSEAELRQRNLFLLAAGYWRRMTNEDKKSYHEEWKRSKYLFNGKPYATLRGYVMARYISEHKKA